MTRRERARLIRALVWPLTLLIVAVVMIGGAQGLAKIDGFRLYGVVQALGEIVGVIGFVWLIAVVIGTLAARTERL